MAELLPHLLLAWSTYVVGTASPGPANLAIMGTSMEHGRRAGMVLALGVISGSLFWGVAATLGLAALFETFAAAFVVLKIVAGAYLLWLAWRSLRMAISVRTALPAAAGGTAEPLRRYFIRGLAIHLTNPKAVIVWAAVIAMGTPAAAASPSASALYVLAGCALLGVLVFLTYALAFSTPAMIRLYGRLRRWIQGGMAVLFAAAGVKLLFARP